MKLLRNQRIDVIRSPNSSKTIRSIRKPVSFEDDGHYARGNNRQRKEIDENDDRERPDELEEVVVLLVAGTCHRADLEPAGRRSEVASDQSVSPETVSVYADVDDDEKEHDCPCDVQSIETLRPFGGDLNEGGLQRHGHRQPDGQMESKVRDERTETTETVRRSHDDLTDLVSGERLKPFASAEHVEHNEIHESRHQRIQRSGQSSRAEHPSQ